MSLTIAYEVCCMKKTLKVTAIFCLIIALFAVISGISAFNVSSRSFWIGYSLFRLIANGSMMGFIGNIAVIAFTAVSFGLAGLNVLADRKKQALIWSGVTSLLAIIMLVSEIAGHRLMLGDFIVAAVPIVQTLLIIKSAD